MDDADSFLRTTVYDKSGESPYKIHDTDGSVRGRCYAMPTYLNRVHCHYGDNSNFDAAALFWCTANFEVPDN